MIISCGVAVVFYMVILSFQVNSNTNVHHAESIDQTIARMQVYNDLASKLSRMSEIQNNTNFYASLEANLLQVNSGILVANDNKVIYESKLINDINKDVLLLYIKQEHLKFSYNKYDYMLHYIKDGSTDNKYIFVYKQEKGMSGYSIAFISAIVSFLICYIICCLYINYRLNRKLIKPIMQIKDAAVNISAGELDSIIVVDTQDEIEDLSKSLEFLRLKLKESIHLQKKYDDNRAFLISSISHDLRTPVTTIKGYVEAIRDGIANSPERKEHYLKIIDKKANQINEMIEDLLLYSKLDLNQLPFTFTKINIVNYLQDGMEEFTPFFNQHHVRASLINDLDHEWKVSIDLMRFMRVIQNIWNNAVIYNDKEDKLVVMSIRDTYSSIIIEVKDNGKGIDEEEATQIFDRFYRTDRSRHSEQGSGLGLAIAKQIVEAHQGQIWARGQLGKGTSIFISLPKIKE